MVFFRIFTTSSIHACRMAIPEYIGKLGMRQRILQLSTCWKLVPGTSNAFSSILSDQNGRIEATRLEVRRVSGDRHLLGATSVYFTFYQNNPREWSTDHAYSKENAGIV